MLRSANDVTEVWNKRTKALWDDELKKVVDEKMYINKKLSNMYIEKTR